MIKSLCLYVAAIVGHLWRLATFNPAVRELSDTPATWLPFALLYLAAGTWQAVLSEPITPVYLAQVGLAVLVSIVAVPWLTRQKGYSLVPVALIFGTSFIADVLAIGCYLADLLPSVSSPLWLTYHVGMAVRVLVAFLRSPPEVRHKGYQAGKPVQTPAPTA